MSRRGRKRHEEHENHERWLVSYADFITLLFAFFVVMYATSNGDQEKQQKFEESVRSELKLTVMRQGMGGMQGVNDELIPQLINPIDDRFPRRGTALEVQDYVERQLKKYFTQKEIDEAGLQVRSDAFGARVSLAAESFFPAGDTRLKRGSLDLLNKLAAILKESNRQVVIEGHTDDRSEPVPGAASNWELGSLRASSVVRYLVKYEGMNPQFLSAASYADQRPLVPNDSDEHRARNRRIDILITTQSVDQ